MWGNPAICQEFDRASTADGRCAKGRGVAVGGVKVQAHRYLVKLECPGTLLQNMPTCLLARGVGVCVFGVLPCCVSEAGSCSFRLMSLMFFEVIVSF